MTTTFEHLSVELFYEIFAYFQLHELLEAFSNLNGRLTAILTQMPMTRVYLGLNGMSMALTQFYYNHLSDPNIYSRLISLCVSDTMAIGNGTWLALHLHRFTALDHLALIDIQQVDFESILNILSSASRLVGFYVKFTKHDRALSTYGAGAESIYHERIFRSLPQLRVCRLGFPCHVYISDETILRNFILPVDPAVMTIDSVLPRLQSLFLDACSLAFLSLIIRYVPQLRELSFTLNRPWLCEKLALRNSNIKQIAPMDRSRVFNLRRLKIYWNNYQDGDRFELETPTQLFSQDVFFHLTHFSLEADHLNNEVVHELLSMLSAQCSYSLDLCAYLDNPPIVNGQSITSTIVLNTFRQLRGCRPMEITLEPFLDEHELCVYTLPRKCSELDLTTYLSVETVLAQDRWPDIICRPDHYFPCVTRVIFDTSRHPELVDHFTPYLPSIVPWHQIVHLTVNDTLELTDFRSILSYASRVNTLQLTPTVDDMCQINDNVRLLLFDLLDDAPTCNRLMSNGLRRLIFSIPLDMSTLIDTAHLIVERFPGLEIIEIRCYEFELPICLHILINGLPKLIFLVAECGTYSGESNELKLRALQTPGTRSFRTEVRNSPDCSYIAVWL